jgi:flagellin-like hook-associated protein FlgL
MLAGLDAFNSTFLLDLDTTQNQITQINQQLSSGYRVSQASDDPADIASILGYQGQINQIAQVQTNLGLASTQASAADNALTSAGTLLQQLTSIAAEGASNLGTPVVGGAGYFGGNNLNLNTAGPFLSAGATENFVFHTTPSGGAATTQTVTVTGTAAGITGAAVLTQLNTQLSAANLGITASLTSGGTLQFSDTNGFSVTDAGSGTLAAPAAPALLSAGTTITASNTSDATRTTLGAQVQAIEQQLVNLANTSVQGQYVFGGDDPSTQPYTFNWSVSGGATQNNTATNTDTIQDISGQTTVPRMTAQQIFGAQNADGTPAPGNILQVAYALGQALQTNNQAGVLAATEALTTAVTQLGQATTFYGNAQNWIQNASTTASSASTTLQGEVGSLRDTDIAAAATQLTTEQTALQAAIAAHGSLSVKSLFDYMG